MQEPTKQDAVCLRSCGEAIYPIYHKHVSPPLQRCGLIEFGSGKIFTFVTFSHEISVKSHFGYFNRCTILKTRAPADYFGILGLIYSFDLRLFGILGLIGSFGLRLFGILGLIDSFDLRLVPWERVTFHPATIGSSMTFSITGTHQAICSAKQSVRLIDQAVGKQSIKFIISTCLIYFGPFSRSMVTPHGGLYRSGGDDEQANLFYSTGLQEKLH